MTDESHVMMLSDRSGDRKRQVYVKRIPSPHGCADTQERIHTMPETTRAGTVEVAEALNRRV
jgi:hypothetical protein